MVLAACCLIALPDAPRLIAFEDVALAPVFGAAPAGVASAADIASRLPQAAVIPAALQTTEVPTKVAAKPKATSGRATGSDRPAKYTLAHGANQRQIEARPFVVRASAHSEITAPQVQLVMQMTQYDERGSAIFNLCVWRVTFESGNQQAVRQEVIVRSL